MNRSDQEIVGLTLETLVNIMSFEPNVSEPDKQNADADLAKQFSEIFLKKPENISTLLELLEVSFLVVCLMNCSIQVSFHKEYPFEMPYSLFHEESSSHDIHCIP